MGRAISWITASVAAARVAGQPGELGLAYMPAHTINGKPYNQRVTFTAYVNSNKGIGADGSQGRSDQFGFVAYGALADSICRSLSNGQAFDAILKPHSYLGRSFDANRTMRLEADGTPIMVRKTGFQIVDSPIYGEDSIKTIDMEIAAGRRPVNWEKQNHPDAATWTQMLKDRANVQYVPGSTIFCYARVLQLTGVGVAPVAQVPTGPAAKAARLAVQAGGVAVPISTTTNTTPPATPPAAVDQTQLAALIAQVLDAKEAAAKSTVVGTERIDPKTGFPIATNTAGTTAAF